MLEDKGKNTKVCNVPTSDLQVIWSQMLIFPNLNLHLHLTLFEKNLYTTHKWNNRIVHFIPSVFSWKFHINLLNILQEILVYYEFWFFKVILHDKLKCAYLRSTQWSL